MKCFTDGKPKLTRKRRPRRIHGTTKCFELLESRDLLAASPVINEFMARNDLTLVDGDGFASDWIEIHNAGDEPIDLAGWHLTDDPTRLDRWTFPDGTPEKTRLDPDGYLLVFASGKSHADGRPYVDADGNLHTDFRIDGDGEFLALVGAGGIVSQFGTATEDFPEQYEDVSYGLSNNTHVYFTTPTPAEANGHGVAGIVQANVQFSHLGSSFFEPFDLALSTAAEAGEIRYTVDGTVPTEVSMPYDGPVRVESTVQIRARVFSTNFGPGPIHSESFVHLMEDVVDFSSPLPILVIENFDAGRVPNKRAHNPPASDGGGIQQVERQFAQLQFYDRVEGASQLSAVPMITSRSGIRVRGSSSANFAKQSLTVEAWDERNNDANISPFNMPAESDWVLYAPSREFDRTLLHNSFIYELSRQIGRYAVRFQFVEVFLNTNGGSLSLDDHAGVYIWMEKIKRDANRVAIEPLSPDGSTGGWMLQSNRMQPIPVGESEHPPNFHTKGPNREQQGPYGRTFTGGTDRGGDDIPTGYNTFLNFEYPRGEDIKSPQMEAIVSWFDEFETALYGPNFNDPELGYRAYIDVESFIDHALLTNLALSFDALQLSTYMFKRSDSHKLELGPIWDFDRAYGADSRAADPTANLEYTQRFLWMPRLFEDPDFAQAYQDRWQELRRGPFSNRNIRAIIDRQSAEITEDVAAANRTSNWPTKLQAMKDWLGDRADAIDGLYLDPPRFDPNQFALPGDTVSVSSLEGQIFYTTDGTDPRLPGGEVAASAHPAQGGVADSITLLAADAPATAIVPDAAFDETFGSSWNAVTFDDSEAAGWKHGTNGIGFDENETYQSYIGLDLLEEMIDVNSSLYARIEFTAESVFDLDFLQLNMRFDDGFIAYLNGVEVARENATGDPTWNSRASAAHRDSLAAQFVGFDLASHIDLLRTGANVLAIHGMNRTTTGNDMLVQAELLAGRLARTPIDIDSGTVTARSFENGRWSGPSVLHVAQPGDANGDGVFNSSDLVLVFQAGEYEDSTDGNSTFQEGDWNGDGDFTTRDLVFAFSNGSFSNEANFARTGPLSQHKSNAVWGLETNGSPVDGRRAVSLDLTESESIFSQHHRLREIGDSSQRGEP